MNPVTAFLMAKAIGTVLGLLVFVFVILPMITRGSDEND